MKQATLTLRSGFNTWCRRGDPSSHGVWLSCQRNGECAGQWRRERDSNPRSLAAQRFSRPPQSSTLPSLHLLSYNKRVGASARGLEALTELEGGAFGHLRGTERAPG